MKSRMLIICALLAAVMTGACASNPVRDAAVLHQFSGNWQGAGDVASKWVKKRQLSFDLTIAADGTISGMAGEAVLRNGRLMHGHSLTAMLYRLPYVFEAELEGPVIAAEDIRREKLEMLVKYTNGQLISAARAWNPGQEDREMVWIYRIRLTRPPLP